MNFRNLIKRTGKKHRIIAEKVIAGQTYRELDGCNGNVKMIDTQLTYQNFAEREQLLKHSAP